jgi:hypothetical protein
MMISKKVADRDTSTMRNHYIRSFRWILNS